MSKFYNNIFWPATILLSALYFNASAQKNAKDTISRDYIINLKGDTIKGQVIEVGEVSVRIDPFSGAHVVKYRVGQIKEIRQTGVIYMPIDPLSGFRELVIAKRVEHGGIDLYEYIQENDSGPSQNTWFAGNIKNPPSKIKAGNKKQLLTLLADNEGLTREFETKKDYNIEYLRDLIRRYNKQAQSNGK